MGSGTLKLAAEADPLGALWEPQSHPLKAEGSWGMCTPAPISRRLRAAPGKVESVTLAYCMGVKGSGGAVFRQKDAGAGSRELGQMICGARRGTESIGHRLSCEEPACNTGDHLQCRRCWFNLWVGKIP